LNLLNPCDLRQSEFIKFNSVIGTFYSVKEDPEVIELLENTRKNTKFNWQETYERNKIIYDYWSSKLTVLVARLAREPDLDVKGFLKDLLTGFHGKNCRYIAASAIVEIEDQTIRQNVRESLGQVLESLEIVFENLQKDTINQ
jgi:hypothetical protein